MAKKIFAQKYTSVKTVSRQDRRDDGYPKPEPIRDYDDYVELITRLSCERTRGTKTISQQDKESQPVVRFLHNEEATAFVVDYDNISRATYKHLRESVLPSLGLKCFMHTTSKHTKDSPRCRIIFPLAERVRMQLVDRRAYNQVIQALGLPNEFDKQTCSANRNWFVPTCSVSRIKSYGFEGRLLSLADIKADAKKRVRIAADNTPEESLDPVLAKDAARKARKGVMNLIKAPLANLLEGVCLNEEYGHAMKVEYEGTQMRIQRMIPSESRPALQLYCDCPLCKKVGKLNIIVGIGAKVLRAECYCEACSGKINKDAITLNEGFDDVKFDAEYLLRVLRKHAVTFRLKNVMRVWWRIDGSDPIPAEDVARCVTQLSGEHINDVLRMINKNIDHTLDWGFSLQPLADDRFERSIFEFANLKPHQKIGHNNLLILKGDIENLRKQLHAPVCGVGLERSIWKQPSIFIGKKAVTFKGQRKSGPVCVDDLEKSGYKLLNRKTISRRMKKLPPVILVSPPDKPSEQDLILFRQRIFLALERGCMVCVVIGDDVRTTREVAAELRLKRGRECGLKSLTSIISKIPSSLPDMSKKC